MKNYKMFTRTLLRSTFALWISILGGANATVFVATDGSDTSPDCRDASTPYATVGRAIDEASWGEAVMVGPGTYTESGLVVDKNLKIIGAGISTTIIQGHDQQQMAPARIITVTAVACVEISNLTIARGFAQDVNDSPNGGAILNHGNLSLRNTKLNECNAGSAGHGGGLYNSADATLDLHNSWIDSCHAGAGEDSSEGVGQSGGHGGGLANLGNFKAVRTAITHCNAGRGGDGLESGGDGGFGGGIYNVGTGVFHCGTISGCCAGDGGNGTNSSGGIGGSGGGIDSTNFPIEIGFSTGTGCKAGAGGEGPLSPPGGFGGFGGCIHNNSALNQVILHHSILSGNSVPSSGGGPDFGGAVTSEGYNIVGDSGFFTLGGDMTGNQLGVDPKLLPLTMNGGLSPSHALDTGSPAIEASDPLLTEPLIDQRGFPRAGRFDIGAYEFDSVAAADLDNDGTPDLADADKDGDNMEDAWEEANNLNSSDPADGPMDKDGDGIDNATEFAFKTDPCNPGSRPQLIIKRMGDRLTFTLTPIVPGQKYSLRVSTSLKKFEGVPSMTNLSTDDPINNPLLFEDGFESGDTAAWSATTP